jgi:hypothetical protein
MHVTANPSVFPGGLGAVSGLTWRPAEICETDAAGSFGAKGRGSTLTVLLDAGEERE